MCSVDLTCVNGSRIQLVLYANCFLGLTYGFLNKNFKEIKLCICRCSFITLAQNTIVRLQIVRFLEALRLIMAGNRSRFSKHLQTGIPVFSENFTNRKKQVILRQAILKRSIDLKFSVWFTLGSENETVFCDT